MIFSPYLLKLAALPVLTEISANLLILNVISILPHFAILDLILRLLLI